MKSSFNTYLYITFILIALTGCKIFSNDIEVEKRISMYFEAESLGDTLTFLQDSLVITDFKFSVDRFVISGNEIELESSPAVNTFLFAYDLNATQERLVIDVGLGIADNYDFYKYIMYVQPIGETSEIIDEDFAGENNYYSMVIKGNYNRKDFRFRISPSFDKTFNFDPVSLSDINETLLLVKSINLYDVFVNPDGSVLNPTDSNNNSIIKERVSTFLELKGFAVNYY